MTIKHAIPKIECAIELLYNSLKTGSQLVWRAKSWRSEKLESRCGRESHHPAEAALWTPSEFGDQTSWWEDAGMSTCSREAGPPGPRLSSLGERERHTAMSGGAGEVNMLQSLFGLQLPLTCKPYNKVRGIFLKKSSLVVIIVSLWFCMHM